MMKVCWLTSVAAPYTIRLFDEIAASVDLYVVMDDKKEENRNEEWKVEDSHAFHLYRIGNGYQKKIRELAKLCDVLIDGLYLSVYGFEAVSAFRRKGKKVVMAADGGIARDRGFAVNKIMSFFMNRHDLFLSSSKITDRYFIYYGVDPEKIHYYRFTSLSEEDIADNRKMRLDREGLRRQLGMAERYTMISVGQPIPRKGFDILVRAYEKSGLADAIDLYIIGGKAQPEVEKYVKDNDLKNVHFIDLLPSRELSKYYGASDLFILCTREDIWGLVIQEAMSYGLAVITSDECVAGLHFNQFEENVAICRNEDIDGYAEKIRLFYEHRDDHEKTAASVMRSVEPYSIENSSKDIIQFLTLL